jgi:hypothetical protein
MTTKTTSTALAVIDPKAYPVLAGDAEAALVALKDNLGDSSIQPFDLDIVSVPAGGGTSWAIPDLAGEREEKTIEGIIVHHQMIRSYWSQSFDESGGGTPPDCVSQDGKVGVGNPGGACAICPLNTWGSAGKGKRGKACQERHLVFLLREGEHLPLVVNTPPSSLGNIKKLMLRLTSKGIPYWTVLVSLALERDKNADGILYSKVTALPIGMIGKGDLERLAEYREAILPSLRRVDVQEVMGEERSATDDVSF